MTTYQDPPPQSRRSARQSERGEQAETTQFGQFTGEQPFAQQAASQQAAPQQAAPQQAAPQQLPPHTVPPQSGRRARAAAPEYEQAAEPLNYTTQGREPEAYEAQLPAAGYAPAPQEPAAFRVRDFSPEGGRRAAAPPLIEPQQQEYPAGASDLDYRTQAAPPPAAVPADPAAHQTLSRRELRQRQAEAEAAMGGAPQALQEPPQPTPAPYPGSPLQAPPPSYQAAPPPAAPPFQAPMPQAAPPQAPAPQYQQAPPPMGPPSTMTTPPAQRTAPPTALSNAMAEFEALTRNGQPPAPDAAPRVPDAPVFIEPELEHTGGWVAPVGHWSRQADLDDETQPWENTITRDVGGGNVATTTSALVLPEIPRPTAFPTALDSTGEVLLTGSIDLPPSLSTGGGDTRRYDDPAVDMMFDTQDAEFTGTDSSPVRAVRAVSTHTSSRGVIHTNKAHGNRLIVVVFIATAVLAIGVVGMLVASLVLDLF
jgi:hypothetical protein